MRKRILTLLLVVSVSFAFSLNSVEKISAIDESNLEIENLVDLKNLSSAGFGTILYDNFTCSLSATGTVESAEFGTMTVTITVEGACDASLSHKLRAAIAKFRAEA